MNVNRMTEVVGSNEAAEQIGEVTLFEEIPQECSKGK